ncbi:MAG: dihydropteroate synthase [Syntrophomonadaceae bacterium]|nr:dihydropteroate synthase [Syntrophomonadaceae bacterium]
MKGDHVVFIPDRQQAEKALEEIGADRAGIQWMAPKAVFRVVKLKSVPCPAANIIKQEMLSKGGEAAVKRDTVSGQGDTDVLLMGTLRHYRLLVDKLKMQPFGLERIAAELTGMLNSLEEPGVKVLKLLGGKSLTIGERTLIMGILNLTPDSFSDGGRYPDTAAAVARALQMVEEGADIVDIGGMSTRPGHTIVPVEEELRRVVPVVEKLAGLLPVPISVDTYRAEVARACLEAGADIINDISSLAFDSRLAGVIAEYRAPVIIMHNRPGGVYQNLIDDITADLRTALTRATEAGISEDRIIIDPGIGFGKNAQENLVVLKRLREFRSLGKPILLGTSRKRFIGAALDLPVGERLEGSLATVAIGIMNGADIIRVHDVWQSKRVAGMTDAVVRCDG